MVNWRADLQESEQEGGGSREKLRKRALPTMNVWPIEEILELSEGKVKVKVTLRATHPSRS